MAVDGDVRAHRPCPQRSDELGHLIGLVSPQHTAPLTAMAAAPSQCLFTLGRAGGQARPHQPPCRGGSPSGYGRCSRVWLVDHRSSCRDELPDRSCCDVSRWSASLCGSCARHCCLVPWRRRRHQKSIIHQEVLARQEALHFRLRYYRQQEFLGDPAFQQSIPVL